MYVYVRSGPGLYTVGFYSPDGEWHPESDWNSTQKAAERVRYLNGGREADDEATTGSYDEYQRVKAQRRPS